MTLQECYIALNGNYADIGNRLKKNGAPNDSLIEKIMLMFLADDSMDILRRGVEAGDHDTAFRGAHTLKGVAANVAFTELQQAASDLTEQLRNNNDPADPELLAKVEKCYAHVIEVLKEYKAQK